MSSSSSFPLLASSLDSVQPSESSLQSLLSSLQYFKQHPEYLNAQPPDVSSSSLSSDAPSAAIRREVRKLLLAVAVDIDRSQLQLKSLDHDGLKRREFNRREKMARQSKALQKREADKKHIEQVNLRRQRIEAMKALQEEHASGVIDQQGNLIKSNQQLLIAGDDEAPANKKRKEEQSQPQEQEQQQTIQDETMQIAQDNESAMESVAAAVSVSVSASASDAGALSIPVPASASASLSSSSPSVPLSSSVFSSAGLTSLLSPSLPLVSDYSSLNPSTTLVSSPDPSQLLMKSFLPKAEKMVNSSLAAAPGSRKAEKAKFAQEGIHINQSAGVSPAASQAPPPVPPECRAKVTVEDEIEEPSTTHDPSDPYASDPDFGPELAHPRSCYQCKARFFRLHRFYDQFCPQHAKLNWAKRHSTADLNGKVFILTGSRVKIGFCIGLKLLRCGATLICTSRFPVDTALRYRLQPDYNDFSSRLHVYGLDLRDLHAVVAFCEFVKHRYDRLDGLISNAAQTVRRPPQYYQHLLPMEMKEPQELKEIGIAENLQGDAHQMAAMFKKTGSIEGALESSSQSDSTDCSAVALLARAQEITRSGGQLNYLDLPFRSAFFSQLETPASDLLNLSELPDEIAVTQPNTEQTAASLVIATGAGKAGDRPSASSFFPSGMFDLAGQALDLRHVNSWLLCADQVSATEVIECMTINALAPFIMAARLKSLMICTPGDKWVINVSAMEGRFYRFKAPYHPHTNMAKAALNMFTRTSAQEYARYRIYMNSVDTGWVNDENPHPIAQNTAERNNFQTPIDELDGAMRVLDPILTGVNKGINAFGKFLKNYDESEW